MKIPDSFGDFFILGCRKRVHLYRANRNHFGTILRDLGGLWKPWADQLLEDLGEGSLVCWEDGAIYV